MKKISTMGELLIDFVPLDKPGTYERKFGGAPGNVAATVALLGGNAVFYGAVGNDIFGDYLIESIKSYGVDASHIKRKAEARTGITFVTNDKAGNRSFLFYRNPSADMLYSEADYLDDSGTEDIFAFSSISLIDYPIKDAHRAIIKKTSTAGGLIVFDANLRIHLWKDEEKYREIVKEFISLSDIIKVSEDEIFWITKKSDIDAGIKHLKSLGPKMIILTLGENGAEMHLKKRVFCVKGFKVDVVDTTGAGDAFLGAFLYRLAREAEYYSTLGDDLYQEILTFANAVAALSTTKKGAVSAIPSVVEVETFIKNNG